MRENYAKEIIAEQRELLEDEVLGAEGAELEETEQRLAECITALALFNKKWIEVEKRTPHCFEEGEWDGKKSNWVFVLDKYEKPQVAVCYHGFMDGSEFTEFYSPNDYEIENVIYWMDIPSAY